MAAERGGDAEKAMNHLRQAAEARLPYLPAIDEFVRRSIRDGRYAEARRVLENGLTLAPDNLKILNSLAMLLATCPDDAVRNGSEALRLAIMANEKTNHSQPALLCTLAAAQAETGDFAAAIETANKALAIVGEQQTPLRGMLNKQLEDFRAGRPYRSKQNR